MKGPLKKLKILDFSTMLPGPYGTMILADMGAEVIKIENPRQLDLMRFAPPVVDGISAVYSHINRGKRSLTVDLKQPASLDIIHDLISDYDIIVEQFRPGVMEKMGLGYTKLKAIKNDIIYCSLSGYGQTGSYARRAGHDINYMALSGLDSFSGREESGPSFSGLQIADIAGGSKNLAIALLAAYIRRLETGKGDYIDISITDSAFAMSVFSTAAFLNHRQHPAREGEMLNGGFLYDYYKTKDHRYLAVGPIEPHFFKAFCTAIGRDDLSEEGIGNRDRKKEIAGIIATRASGEWEEIFKNIDACVEPVRTLGEAIASPPLTERDMIISVSSHMGNELVQTGNPIKFSSGKYQAENAGVPPGHDNEDILRGLGYSENKIKQLINDTIIPSEE